MSTAIPIGVWGPRTDNFEVKNVNFVRFDKSASAGPAAAISSCSHCWHDAATDSGARTITFSGLTFDTTPFKVRYTTPFRAIYFDKDGSLTGKGTDSWMSPYYSHNEWATECDVVTDVNTDGVEKGIVCTSAVQVRRIAFFGYQPSNFRLMEMRIGQWDTDQEAAAKLAYNDDDNWQ